MASRKIRAYAAMIESLDQSVGRVVARLAELGLRERTLIIFTSDNGGLAVIEGPHTPATINTPHREGKGWMYEGGTRVPLIANWPTVVSPGEIATPAWSCDVYPTVLEMCGLHPEKPVDGVSIAPVLADRGEFAPRTDVLALSALQQPGWPARRRDSRRGLEADRVL